MKKTQKGMSKILLIVIIGILIVISAIMFGYGGESVQDAKEDVTEKAQEVIDEKSVEAAKKVVDNGQAVIGKKLKETGEKMLEENEEFGYYGNYGDAGVDDYDNVILFFTADWCPSCVSVGELIEKDNKKIPADVAIVKVDFDEDVELKEEYEVSKQHTFVLVGKNEENTKKWEGSETLSEIIDNVK